MATDTNTQIQALQRKQQATLDALRASSTARAGGQSPSNRDLVNQQSLLRMKEQLDKIQSKQQADRWYGKEEETVTKPPGLFMGALDKLSRPFYTIAGAADYLAGTSPSKSLFESMNQNQKVNKRSFGNILSDLGASKYVSAPLGLAMDIAFDPVNWATLGTSALIPRTAVGFAKGAAKGGIKEGFELAGKGAASRLLEVGMTARGVTKAVAGKLRPTVGKLAKLEAEATRAATRDALIAGAKEVPKGMFQVSKAAVTSLPKKVPGFMKGLEEKAVRLGAEYNAGIGKDVLGNIAKAGTLPEKLAGSEYRLKMGDIIRDLSERAPVIKKYFKYFDYNNAEWTRLAKIRDSLLTSVGESEETDKAYAYMKAILANKEEGIDLDAAFKQYFEDTRAGRAAKLASITEELPLGDFGDDAVSLSELLDDANFDLQNIKEEANAVNDILKKPEVLFTNDAVERGLRMAEEATGSKVLMDDIKRLVKWEGNASGWEWWDNLRRKAVSSEKTISILGKEKKTGDIMQSVLNSFDYYMTVFKRAAVGASPTAWTNAVMGNPVMAWMAGVNIFDPIYAKRIQEGARMSFGKASPVLLEDLFAVPSFADDLAKNPTLFKQTVGLSYDQIKGKYTINQILRIAKEQGMIGRSVTPEEFTKIMANFTDELTQRSIHAFTEGADLNKDSFLATAKFMEKKKPTGLAAEIRGKSAAGQAVQSSDIGTSFMAGETLNNDTINKMLSNIEIGAKSGRLDYKIADFLLNKMPDAYGGIDQTFKMGTFKYVTLDGLTERELKTIGRMMNLETTDLTQHVVNGVTRYKLNAAKGLELANEIYLNYAAMPAAVKVLRNLPLIGSPFAAFSYGMALKTAKTAAYNPAAFNKVQFGLKEFSGDKSPLEKEVLSSGRYSYLNAPNMVKMTGLANEPFFQTNSIYLNVANWVPYYSLNMFGEGVERSYQNRYSNAIIKAIDVSPIMKDPVGQTLFDFFIQPMVMSSVGDNSRAKNMFGQYILPIDPSAKEYIGYALRGIVDPLVPGIVAPIGGFISGHVAPNKTEFMPSYKWRRVANAVQGKTPVGVIGKESKESRTGRALLGGFGVPIQSPVINSYLPKETLQELKKTK